MGGKAAKASSLAGFWEIENVSGSGGAIVIKYSGHAMWFGPILGKNLWQLSRLA